MGGRLLIELQRKPLYAKAFLIMPNEDEVAHYSNEVDNAS